MVVFHELSKTCQIFSMSKTNQKQAMHTRIKLNFYTKIVNSTALKMLLILPNLFMVFPSLYTYLFVIVVHV